MSIHGTLTTAWSRLHIGADAERDPGFRRIIMRRTSTGMIMAGLLALLGILVFILSYLIRGHELAFARGGRDVVVLWDELIVLAGGALVVGLSQTRTGQRYGRWWVAVLSFAVALAILIEDAGSRDFSFTPGYLSLVLIVVTGTMPYRPIHVLALCGLMTVMYVVFVSFIAPAAYGIDNTGHISRLVYMIVLTVMLVGISAALYAGRYQQYESLKNLSRTQAQLVQSEKMASLGQLTAGIAHEIKNPLNFINNFAELNLEHVCELDATLSERAAEMSADLRESIRESLDYIRVNAGKIREQGQRVDAIVRAMMLHARGKPGERGPTDLNALLDEYVNLAYYGIRVTQPGSLIAIEREYDPRVGIVEIVPQELARVIINLLNNAFDAVHDRAAATDGSYQPVISITTQRRQSEVLIRVRDNGPGISPEIRRKIFDPFFTTKPAGMGTGLGLSMSYDIIVEGHGGKIEVNSTRGQGAEFVIRLPAAPVGRSIST